SYQRGDLPAWNPTIFLGTPLLAAYRPGALYPLMTVLAVAPPFTAFQLLVLVSLAASAVLVFVYVRRLGAERVGAFVGGLSLALVAAGLLASPQLVPTLVAARDAGRSMTALADRERPLPGLFGLVLRYASHTPAASLALAALPLALTQRPIRVLGLALAICLALQWGRGPLSAPGAMGLVFDLTLCVLAGLSLSAHC